MKIKVGDKVKYLNSVGGGRVISIQKNIAQVMDNDGFEVPVKVTELLPANEDDPFGGGGRETETQASKQDTAEEPAEESMDEDDYWEKEDDSLKIYLGFVPEDEQNLTSSNMLVYLINDSNYFLLYNYALPEENSFISKSSGKLEPNTKEAISKLEREKMDDIKAVMLQIIPLKTKAYNLQNPIDKAIKINAVKFFKASSFKENDFFDEPAIIHTVMDEFTEKLNKLSDDDINAIIKEKEEISPKLNQPQTFTKKEEKEQEEVDLHIHELLDDERGLSNKEMLELQLDYFRKKMNEATKSNLKRIVFIHGVGNGTLKLELRKELARNYSRYRYQDASFAEYGYGATLVHLK